MQSLTNAMNYLQDAHKRYLPPKTDESNEAKAARASQKQCQISSILPEGMLAGFLHHQFTYSLQPIVYSKSKKSNILQKATTIAVGQTISGLVEALYNVAQTVAQVFKAVFNTLDLVYQSGKFLVSKLTSKVKSNVQGSLNNLKGNGKQALAHINAIVRNALRAIPALGMYVAVPTFDTVEVMTNDAAAKVAKGASSISNYVAGLFKKEKPQPEEE